MDYEFLHDLIHKLPLGYVYYKVENNERNKGIVLDANEAFEQIFGLKRQLIIGKRFSEIISQTQNNDFESMISSNQTSLQKSNTLYTKNIALHDCWYKMICYSPKSEYFVRIFQDISFEMESMRALKVQRKKLEQMTDELETIFNGTHDALFLVENNGGRFRYIRNNKTYQNLSGLFLQDIEGKSPEEVMGKEQGQTLSGHYNKCFAQGKAITYEQKLMFPTGNKIWMTNLTPIYKNGKVTHLIGSGNDITEFKKLQENQLNLLNLLQSMFRDHTAIMLMMEPASGMILDANPAACNFYGYTRDEILRLRIQDINTLSENEVKKQLQSIINKTQNYFLMSHRLKNGQVRLVDIYSSPVLNNGRTVLFSIIFDVTDREKYKEDLYLEKEFLSKTLNSMGEGVVAANNEGVITALNQAAQQITGWSNNDAKNHYFSDIFELKSEETGELVTENLVSKVLKKGKFIGFANHTELISRQASSIPIAYSAAPITDEEGKIFGVVVVFRDVSREREKNKKILYLSFHDSLTGLYNRRFIEQELLRLRREKQYPFALIMGDVNGLKITNDIFGHKTGDKLLQKVAKVLTENCCEEDIISRWGGDEFLILLPHTTAEAAEQVIKKIKSSLAVQNQKTLTLSVAFGCAEMNEKDELQQTLQKAEEWMYHQKLLEGRSYRNAVVNALLCTLYEKSLETEEHDKRLNGCCMAVGKELKLSQEELNELSLLALLHDIGKVGINQNVLQKPGPLSPEEWKEMKRHPEIGYRISQNVPELSIVSEGILCHHERWDGKGYPNGLAGNRIPLLCRIVAVADAYDAMTNDRVYRKSIGKEKAIAELKNNSGTQFDPLIVSTFIKSLSKI